MIEVDEAIKIILMTAERLCSTHSNISESCGKVIAEDIRATDPFPAFPTSIMDGYAVYAPLAPGRYEIQNRVLAGAIPLSFDPGIYVKTSTLT